MSVVARARRVARRVLRRARRRLRAVADLPGARRDAARLRRKSAALRARLDGRRVVSLMSGTVTHDPAGLAGSVIRRCDALGRAGVPITLLVDVLQPELRREVALLRAADQLPPQVAVHGLYDDLLAALPSDARVARASRRGELAGIEPVVAPDLSVARYYVGDEYVAFENRALVDGGGFVDFLENGRRRWRERFDSTGVVVAVTRYDDRDQPIGVDHVDAEGRVALAVTYTGGEPSGYVLYPGTAAEQALTDADALLEHWLDAHHGRDLTGGVLVSEWAFRRVPLERLAARLGTRVVYTTHNNHLGAPYRYGSPVKSELVDLVEHIDELDTVVVLSHDQWIDLRKATGSPLENVVVVPHAAPPARPARDLRRVTHDVILLGRYAPEKGQVEAVEAFARVVEEFPSARLHLYGRGPTRDDIQAAIRRGGLGRSVKLHEFTSDADAAFRRAAVAIFPSSFEGQPLSLLEAMSAGCVPVVYDFKYGARTMVRHGVDGLVVDPGNVVELMDSVRLLLREPATRRAMSRAASRVGDAFSTLAMQEAWLDLLAAPRREPAAPTAVPVRAPVDVRRAEREAQFPRLELDGASVEELRAAVAALPQDARVVVVRHGRFARPDTNVMRISRQEPELRVVVEDLVNAGLHTYRATPQESFLVRDVEIPTLWDPVRKGELAVSPRGLVHVVRPPLVAAAAPRLAVVFSSMAAPPLYGSSLTRFFEQNFSSIQRHLVDGTSVLRIADIGGVIGGFYLPTTRRPDAADAVGELIASVVDALGIAPSDVVLYGGSKGGTAALFHGLTGGYPFVAVDPVVNDEYYETRYDDTHFTRGAVFPERKATVFGRLLADFRTGVDSGRVTPAGGTIITSRRSPLYVHSAPVVLSPPPPGVTVLESDHPEIKDHPDVSAKTLRLATSVMNMYLSGLELAPGVRSVDDASGGRR